MAMRHLSRLDKVNYGISVLGSLGISKSKAIGVMGSLAGESGLNLNTEAYNPNDPGGSEGIGQWNNGGSRRGHGRRSAMRSYVAGAMKANPNKTKYEAQMDFVAHELQTTHANALKAIKAAPDMIGANRAFTTYFEAPSEPRHAARAKNANYYANLVAGKVKDVAVKDESVSGAQFPNQVPTADNTNVTEYGGTEAKPEHKGIFGKLTDTLNSLGDSISGITGDAKTKTDEAGNTVADSGIFGDTSGLAMIGSMAGGAVGGAPGAIIGGILGQVIDRAFNKPVDDPSTPDVDESQSDGILGGIGRAMDSLFNGGSDGSDSSGDSSASYDRSGGLGRVGSATGEPGFGTSAAGDYFGGSIGGNTMGATESGSRGDNGSKGKGSSSGNGSSDSKSKSKAA